MKRDEDYSMRDYYQIAFGMDPEDFYIAVPPNMGDEMERVATIIAKIKIAKRRREMEKEICTENSQNFV
jgi:hypothetical protein